MATVGDMNAYQRIAEAIVLPPEQILFLSDIKGELDAAAEAGMATCWLVRDGALDEQAIHRQVGSFEQIDL